LGEECANQIRGWLLRQQYRIEHPYTHARPGGWAWTDLSGGVPDADDTAGALVALARLSGKQDREAEETLAAAVAGIEWLLKLQNRDGGIPTFCRGWGALPFDRSSPDLTAHAILAWTQWLDQVPVPLQQRLNVSLARAVRYLQGCQRVDGAWVPLWFGNQHVPEEANPLYGTARVLRALGPASNRFTTAQAHVERAIFWLLKARNPDGGWGGSTAVESTTEETALAVETLAETLCAEAVPDGSVRSVHEAVHAGTGWLLARIGSGEWTQPAPIGFYFAKLWYWEKLYPVIFTVSALSAVERAFRDKV
jgi:squalene-hopene/tetraprenyl-beta-curcumene cyclase